MQICVLKLLNFLPCTVYIDCKKFIGQKGVKLKKIKTVDYQQFLTFFCSLNKEIRYRTMAGFQVLQLRRCVTQTSSRICKSFSLILFGYMVRNAKDCYRLLEWFMLFVQYVTCINYKLSDQNSWSALKSLPFWVNGNAKKKNLQKHANRMKRARLLAKTTIGELVYYSWCLEYLLISTRTHTDLSKSIRRIYYWLVPFGHGKGEKMEVSHRNGGIDQQIIAW